MFSYKDQVVLTLLSGHGGRGALSFYRTKKSPRGGPDGGEGGDGGDILFCPDSRYKDLSHFERKTIFKASNGKPGDQQNKSGAQGGDLEIGVPLGTIVRDENDVILLDLINPGNICFLKGGKGGKGNAFFKTSLNQAPRHFQKGMPGIEKKVKLEFKPFADIALLGKPNAGKSTFLNFISKASSPVASYPYTTLSPYLGKVSDTSCFAIDIPGLAKGASEKVSKGLSFLRIIQRAHLLLHFIDASSPSLQEDKNEIEAEIKQFSKNFSEKHFVDLDKKTRFLVFSKIDQVKEAQLKQIKKQINPDKKMKEFYISCLKEQGIQELMSAVKKEISI